ncbi:MAG TPA: glycosyltransferase [Acidimicrobiales bacterium]|nr:glycosyltransferase [Acidimicrobiales bacterium]
MRESPVTVDISALQSVESRGRGIARYALSWCIALERTRPDLVGVYGLNPALAPPGDLRDLLASGKVAQLSTQLARRASIFHQLSPFDLLQPAGRLLPNKLAPQLTSATVYDLIPARDLTTELIDPIERRRYRTRLELVRSLDHIQVLSSDVERDLCGILGLPGSGITIVGAAPDPAFVRALDRDAVRNSVITSFLGYGLNRRYVLYPSGSHPRKNNERLVRAWARVPPHVRSSFQLVITGAFAPSTIFHLENLADELGTQGDLVMPGYVGDRDFVRVVQGADLVCFPSLAEGFGLPIVEALACDTPVIASSISPHDELLVARDLFDASEASAIADRIERALIDPGIKEHHQISTWDDVAQKSAAAFDAMLRNQRARPAPRPLRRERPRLAIVSPFPASPTGIARYSYRLAEAIAKTDKVDLTCFFDGPSARQIAPDEITGYRVESLLQVERLTGRFDEVVYVFGNSHHHLGAFAMLKQRRGLVMSHDVRLSNLYRHLHGDPGFLPGGLGREIRAMYREQLPESIGATGQVEERDIEKFGILMARDVIAMSSSFLVTSTAAKELAKVDARLNSIRKIAVLPFAMEAPSIDDAGIAETSSECPPSLACQMDNLWGKPPPQDQKTYLAHFGIVDPVKNPSLLIDMLAELRQREDLRLVFVGPISDALCFELTTQARDLGIDDRVFFTGPLGSRDYLAWLCRVSLALQLRTTSNGEASAAIGECLASAVTTVVSDIGWSKELPEEAVVHVDIGITAVELASTSARLLDDVRMRTNIASAGAVHASHYSFDYVARSLLTWVSQQHQMTRQVSDAL